MRNLWLLTLFCGLIAGCKKDDPLSDQEVTLALLTSAEAWQNPTVTIDDVDQSDLYVNFGITFGNKTYTSANGAPIWKAGGVWVFKDETATVIMLDDALEVEITSVSNELLELTFLWNEDTFEPGRVKSVKGKNKFRLKKK